MKKLQEDTLSLWALAISLTLIFLIYLQGSPSTVQTLDTGELVTNAFRLRTIHPPGYPLYTWTYHLFMQLTFLGTVFHRASVLTILFSLLTLAILALSIREAKRDLAWSALGLLWLLATSPTYWKYSLLPEVFMLNNLFFAAISALYLRNQRAGKNSLKVSIPIVLLFALGLTHHLTLVFLFPIILHTLSLLYRQLSWKKYMLLLAVASLFFILPYLSLLLLDRHSLTSWGQLQSVGDVINHLLRKDYGVFRLSAIKNQGQLPLGHLLPLLGQWFALCPWVPVLLLLLLPLEIASCWKERARGLLKLGRARLPLLLYSSCLILCVLVLFTEKSIPPEGMGRDVLERFFLAPTIMVLFLGVAIAGRWKLPSYVPPLAGAVFSVLAAINIFHYGGEMRFDRNTIIEDWAINRLRAIPASPHPTLVLEGSDTGLFSLYYAQHVLGVRPELTVLSDNLIYYPWYADKARQHLPQLILGKSRSTLVDIIEPNLPRFNINVSKGQNTPDRFKVTFLALGRTLSPGKGLDFDQLSWSKTAIRSRPKGGSWPPTLSRQFDQFLHFYSQYSYYNLERGKDAYARSDLKRASGLFAETIQQFPFCWPALRNLCLIKKKLGAADTSLCLKHYATLVKDTYNYFE